MKKTVWLLAIVIAFLSFSFFACDLSLYMDKKKDTPIPVAPLPAPVPEPETKPDDPALVNFESAILFYSDVIETWAKRTINEAEKQKFLNYFNNTYTFSVPSYYHSHSNCPNTNMSRTLSIPYSYLAEQKSYNGIYVTSPEIPNYKLIKTILDKENFLIERTYIDNKTMPVTSVIANKKYNLSTKYDSTISRLVNFNIIQSAICNYSGGTEEHRFYDGMAGDYVTCKFNYSGSGSTTINYLGYYDEIQTQSMCDYIKFNHIEFTLKPGFTFLIDSIYKKSDYIDSIEIVSPEKIVFHFKKDTNWQEDFLTVKGSILSFTYLDKNDVSYGFALTVK